MLNWHAQLLLPLPPVFLMGNVHLCPCHHFSYWAMPGQPEGKNKNWNSVAILNWFAFSTHKIDLMGKIIYFTFEKKSNTKNIRSNIRRKLRHFFTGTEKPLDFNSKLQKIDKVVKDTHCYCSEFSNFSSFQSFLTDFPSIWLFLAKKCTKMAFFDAVWRTAAKNQNKMS